MVVFSFMVVDSSGIKDLCLVDLPESLGYEFSSRTALISMVVYGGAAVENYSDLQLYSSDAVLLSTNDK